MKQLVLALTATLISLSVWAQTVTLQFAGTNKSRNYQVVIDGSTYNSAEAVVSGKNKMFTMTNLTIGSHTLTVYPAGKPIVEANALYSNTFQLRQDYDMDIIVGPNGEVSFTEKRNTQTAVSTGSYDAGMAMNSADFNRLSQSVRGKMMQSARVNALRTAFNNTSNYFTTEQVARLLSYVNAEPTRLELAKAAYARVIDSANYRELYDLFSSESLRSELDFFLRNTTIVPASGATGTSADTSTASAVDPLNDKGKSSSTSHTDKPAELTDVENKEIIIAEKDKGVTAKPAIETSVNTNAYGGRKPLTDRSFNQVTRKLRNQRTQQDKVSMLTGTFQNTGNYFTTVQIRQLITPVTAEADRLTLIKLAYPRTADTANFKSLYTLLNERYSQLELDHYVRYGNAGNTVNQKAKTAYDHRVVIDDADFILLDLKVRFHLQQAGTIAEIKKAFSSNQYFTVQQIQEWLSLVTAEEDRLALAKLAYLRVTDPTTFSSVYDLFQTQSNREELDQFIAGNRY